MPTSQPFMNKFVIFNGNNSFLIKKALEKRGNWEEVTFLKKK